MACFISFFNKNNYPKISISTHSRAANHSFYYPNCPTRAGEIFTTALEKHAQLTQNELFGTLGHLGQEDYPYLIYKNTHSVYNTHFFTRKYTIITTLTALMGHFVPLYMFKGTFFRAVARFTTALTRYATALTTLNLT